MELEKYIGIWENKAGKRLEIKRKDKNSLSVSIFNQGRIPILREYFNNLESINMHAELDYYETSIEVELWEKGKGFHLCLSFDYNDFRAEENDFYLSVGISRNAEDKFLNKFYYLFEPLERYKMIED